MLVLPTLLGKDALKRIQIFFAQRMLLGIVFQPPVSRLNGREAREKARFEL